MHQQAILGLFDGDARQPYIFHDLFQLLFAWQHDRKVTQPQRAGRGRRNALADPGVEPNVMVVAACRDHPHTEAARQ